MRRVSELPPRPWIEVEVGTGRFAQALGIDVGVDPAPGALEYAARRGVRVVEAVGQALPFEDGRFGAAFVIVTLCFADEPAILLREARRALTDEGGVVLGIVPAESPWGRLYAEKARSGHFFYSRAKFFTLGEIERLACEAGLTFDLAASTLLRPFFCGGSFAVEPPRDGIHEDAGFVAVLCRREAENSGREGEPLTCMRDNVEVSREDPRCPHPSSQCRFRKLCPIAALIRR